MVLKLSSKQTVVETVYSINTASTVACIATFGTEILSSVSGSLRIAVLMTPTIRLFQHERIRLLYNIRDQKRGSACRSGFYDGHVSTANNNSKKQDIGREATARKRFEHVNRTDFCLKHRYSRSCAALTFLENIQETICKQEMYYIRTQS
jgi:hypothetical protein